MKRPSKEERRAALANQTKANVSDKDYGGQGGKGIFDFKGKEITRYKAKVKKNKMDIIPYIIATDHHPKGMKKGYDSYVLDLWVHYGVGPMEDTFICLKNTYRKPCPICEERARLLKTKGYDIDVANSLKPKRRVMYNVIDLMGNSDEIQLFEVSHYLFEKELLEEAGYNEEAEGEFITFADLDNGRSIVFRGTEVNTGSGKPYLEFKSFQFEKRDPYEEDILEEAYSLDEFLIVPTYDEVQRAMLGVEDNDMDEAEAEAEAEVERERPRRNRRSRKQENKETEEEKPKKTRSRKSKKASKEVETPNKDEPPFEPDEEEKKENTFGKTCPNGHIFGIDNDDTDHCDDCDIDTWEECARAKKEKIG